MIISKNIKKILNVFIFSSFFLTTILGNLNAGDGNLQLLQTLKGKWQFSIGINEEWISPSFDDAGWESIYAPSPWEDQGFNGYNGYAFYRKKITIPSSYKGRMLYLNMGYIDDVDEVYLNGQKIGSSGSFPPSYSTAYNAERIYYIPENIIKFDSSNLIAVKVYDAYNEGGITSGEIGLYGGNPLLYLDLDLQSHWKFRPGDDLRRKEPDFDDSGWSEIFVPSKWEDQGYRDYDGYAWYRKTFVFNINNGNDKMVLLMGKIDDIDQVFLNGALVGSTGEFPVKPGSEVTASQSSVAFRGYYLPDGLLKKNQRNVIAVRVLDLGGSGGIYEGPIGIISQTKYIEYWRKIKKSQSD